MKNLTKRYFHIWIDMEQAGRLEEIAGERGKGVADVVQDIISPVLDGEDENTGRFVLLRIPEKTYKQHLKWFGGDADLAKQSMVGSVEVTGEDFAETTRKAEGK